MGGLSLFPAKRADADEVRRSTVLSPPRVGVFKVSRQTFHFEVIPRSRRAREAIRDIRLRSKLFKRAAAVGDSARMEAVSGGAWDALTKLFETLRNEHDHRYLDAVHLQSQVGLLIQHLTSQEQVSMSASKRIDRLHPSCRPLTLHQALNKLGHYDGATSTYRVDGRGAHYIVLGGRQHQQNWIAEILISRLCKEAASAANAIRQHPRP